MLNVYLIQMESIYGDKNTNFSRARQLLKSQNIEPGSIILFPEMFATGYIPSDIAEAAEDFCDAGAGITAAFLHEIAESTSSTVIGAGIAKAGAAYTNHSSVYTPQSNKEFAGYDKIHPFFPEQGAISSGAKTNLFKISDDSDANWNVSSTICYDLRFPETYREAVFAGAQLITVQAAWPLSRLMHFETLLRARAIENQCYIAAVNACGNDANNITYAGNSMVVDPEGNVVARAETKEAVIKAEINYASLEAYRERFQALKDAKQRFSH